MSPTGAWSMACVLAAFAGLEGPQAAPQGTTLRVPADHPTIQKGIDAAGPGDTVLVDAGTYKERVRLKAGVILKSAGADGAGKVGLARAEATVIDGEGKAEGGPGVVMAEGSVLDGFTVARIGKFDQAEYDKHYATHGENLPDERGAVGSPEAPVGVMVAGVTATVRNSIVHDNGDAGIALIGGAGKRNGSRVLKNVVYRNMGGGIGISGGATPIVEGNRCFNNLRGGIGNRKSAGLILGNECYDNVRAGIGVREGARPVIRGNKCYKNRRAGIGVRMEKTDPLIEDNDCYENAMAGIGCRDGAEPLIRLNRCYGNVLAGIGVRDGARPVLFGNKCFKNKEAGIGVQSGARATIVHNECYENEKAGIGHEGGVETFLGGNQVHHNKAAGIGFEEADSGKSTILNSKVFDNAKVEVGIHSGWKVRLAGSELSTNEGMPPVIMVYKGAELELSGSVIRGSGVAGVRVEGALRAIGNTFECPSLRKAGPPSYAVWALPGSDIVLVENGSRGWRHALHAGKCAVTALRNRVSDYGKAGLMIEDPAGSVTIVGNVFESETDQAGVALTGGGGIVEDNRVEKPKAEKTPPK